MINLQIAFLNELEEHRDFTEDDTFQVLSLPYMDPEFSFVIFLPKERFGLKDALKVRDSEFAEDSRNLRF